MPLSEENHMKAHKNQWVFNHARSSKRLAGATRRGQTRAPEVQKPSKCPCLTTLPRGMCPQLIVSKALSWGIMRKSACLLADITYRKSQRRWPTHKALAKIHRKPHLKIKNRKRQASVVLLAEVLKG
jgi:hypothetical protein